MNSTKTTSQTTWALYQESEDKPPIPVYYHVPLHTLGFLVMTRKTDLSLLKRINDYLCNEFFFTIGNTKFRIVDDPAFQEYALIIDHESSTSKTEPEFTSLKNLEEKLRKIGSSSPLKNFYALDCTQKPPALLYFRLQHNEWSSKSVEYAPDRFQNIYTKIQTKPKNKSDKLPFPIRDFNEKIVEDITDEKHKASILQHAALAKNNLDYCQKIFPSISKQSKHIIIESETSLHRSETFTAFTTDSVISKKPRQHANYAYIRPFTFTLKQNTSKKQLADDIPAAPTGTNIVHIVTAGCIFGWGLQASGGTNSEDSSKQLFKQNLEFNGDEVIRSVDNLFPTMFKDDGTAFPSTNPNQIVVFKLRFQRLLSFIQDISRDNKEKDIFIHFHLPAIDYMLSCVKLFLRGRMTFNALNEAFKFLLIESEQCTRLLNKTLKDAKFENALKKRIKLKIYSPFEALRKFLGDNIDNAASQFLNALKIDPNQEILPVSFSTPKEHSKISDALAQNNKTVVINFLGPSGTNLEIAYAVTTELQRLLFNAAIEPKSTDNMSKKIENSTTNAPPGAEKKEKRKSLRKKKDKAVTKKEMESPATIQITVINKDDFEKIQQLASMEKNEQELIETIIFLCSQPDNELANTHKKMIPEWRNKEKTLSDEDKKKSPFERFLSFENTIIPAHAALTEEPCMLIHDASERPIQVRSETTIKSLKNPNISVVAISLVDDVLIYGDNLPKEVKEFTPPRSTDSNSSQTSTIVSSTHSENKESKKSNGKNYTGLLFHARTTTEMNGLLEHGLYQRAGLKLKESLSRSPTLPRKT